MRKRLTIRIALLLTMLLGLQTAVEAQMPVYAPSFAPVKGRTPRAPQQFASATERHFAPQQLANNVFGPRKAMITPTFYALESEKYDPKMSLLQSEVVVLNTAGEPTMTKLWEKARVAEPKGGAIFDDGIVKMVDATIRWGVGPLGYGRYASGMYRCYDMLTGDKAFLGGQEPSCHNRFDLYSVAGLAKDPATGKIWGVFEEEADVPVLGTIEMTLSEVLVRGLEAVALPQKIVNIFFGPEGQLYGISSNGYLYKINKEEGQLTRVGYTGINFLFDSATYYGMASTYDAATGKAYWAMMENIPTGEYDYTSRIYELNVSTGQTTLVCNVPGNVHIGALQVIYSEYDGGVPAQPTDLSVTLDDQQPNDVTISFTLPTLTADGNSLSGAIDYQLYVDDILTKQGQGEAGSNVTLKQTLATGIHTFAVILSNEKGQNIPVSTQLHVGHDVFKAPTGVRFTLSGVQATITWQAVTESENGGVLGEDVTPTYRVVRQPDGHVVADGITELKATDQLDEHALANWYYDVYAFNDSYPSKPGHSNRIKHGDYIVPPYTCDFEDVGDFGLFTIINVNEDGRTWQCSTEANLVEKWFPWNAAYYSSYEGAVQEGEESPEGADDWLVTAPIRLQASKTYVVNYMLSTGSSYIVSFQDDPESVEVYLLNNPNPQIATVKQKLEERINFQTNGQPDFVETEIQTEEDGNYYLAWHCTSDPEMWYLWVDDISVTPNQVTENSPAAVDDLTVTPGAKGALYADIMFTAPATTYGGAPLTSIDSIQVLRDNKDYIFAFEQPEPGKQYTFKDENVTLGFHLYRITPYLDGIPGPSIKRNVVIGPDVPGPINDMWANDNLDGTSFTIHVDAPTEVGANGGYVDTEKVGLKLYSVNSNGIIDAVVCDTKNPTEATIYGLRTAQDTCSIKQFVIGRYNDEGQSTLYFTPPLFTGEPKTLPIEEHFSGANGEAFDTSNTFWVTGGERGAEALFGDGSSDGDGHCLSFAFNQGDDYCTLNTLKVSVKGVGHPVLTFDYYAFPGDDMGIYAYVNRAMQGPNQWEFVDAYEHSKLDPNGEIGWYKAHIDLSNYVNEEYIVISLDIYSGEDGLVEMIDNVKLFDEPLPYDLSANVAADEQLFVGNSCTATVTISNHGVNNVEAGAYTVQLYKGEQLIGQVVETAAIEGTETTTAQQQDYLFTYDVTAVDNDEIALRAEVTFGPDNNPANNVQTLRQKIQPNTQLPVATGLQGTADQLSWQSPTGTGSIEGMSVDGFEQYTPLTANGFGGWTVYDGDNYVPRLLNTPVAFTVFTENTLNYTATGQEPLRWQAHTGTQYAAAFGNIIKDNDDWLISPELGGTSFDLSFYTMETKHGYSFPTLDVLYSTTDAQPESFIKLASYSLFNDDRIEWLHCTVAIPTGAKYFAFHYVTNWGSWGIKIDDVTYPRFLGNVGPTDIVGYNIYANGQLLQRVSGDATTTGTALTPHGDAECQVSVIYQLGEQTYESPLSSTISLPSAIGHLTADAQDIIVYNANGVEVARGADAYQRLKPGVYMVRWPQTGHAAKVIKK